MKEPQKKAAIRQVKGLLTLLSMGVFCAVFVSLLTLYVVGPLGSLSLNKVLLSPDVAKRLSYTQEKKQMVFEMIELQRMDPVSQQVYQQKISLDAYQQFYAWVADDRSLASVPEQLEGMFSRNLLTTLTIVVAAGEKNEKRAFQSVEFLPLNDYYRVQMRDADEGVNWAYFYHEDVYEEAMKRLLQ